MPEEEKYPTGVRSSDSFRTFGYVAVGLCLVLVASMGYWHFHNRKWLGPTFNADIEFTQAPDTTIAGQAARFVVHVEQDNKNTPLPNRVMDITVSPAEKAQIISASGASGTNYAKISSRAKAKTDAAGNVSIEIKAAEPGDFTLVALDSTSNLEGTVNFSAKAPGG